MRCFSPDRMPGLSIMLMLFRTSLGSWEHINLEERNQSWDQSLFVADCYNLIAPWPLLASPLFGVSVIPKSLSPTCLSSMLLFRQVSWASPPRESHASFRVTASLGWSILSLVQSVPFPNVPAEVLGPVFTGAPGTMLWLQAQGVASSYGQHPKSSRCFGELDKRAAVSRALARHLQAAFVVHHLPDTTSSSSSQSLCHASSQLSWCWP